MNWPTTSLMRLKDCMRDRENIDLIDLPQKWKTWLAKKANPWSGDQGGGRGRGGRGGPAGQGQQPPQQKGGGPSGGRGHVPGSGLCGGPQQDWSVKHVNNATHVKVKTMVGPLQGKLADAKAIFCAAGN